MEKLNLFCEIRRTNMSDIIKNIKRICVVTSVDSDYVNFDVGNCYLSRWYKDWFSPIPKVGDKFLLTTTLESLDVEETTEK